MTVMAINAPPSLAVKRFLMKSARLAAKMSGRSHVDVNERRLRLIYDCLDNGNNKKALQEADKVLKKQKDLHCAKVLKGLALLRLGRHDESVVLLEEVHGLHPTDESTLLAMAIAYRELHKLDLIADMYENAHKEKPDNEEVLSALFMAYVRLSNYKKQQQTAMKLHRLKPNKNPYYFWAIMSIVMQAHMDNKLAKTMYLPLAERMASKYVTENKIEAEAEVQLYLIVLKHLEKYEEALEIVAGPLGEKLVSDPRFRVSEEAELLTRLKRWEEGNKAYKKMLDENCDDWAYYLAYFKTSFALIDSGFKPEEVSESDEAADLSIEQMVAFLKKQVGKVLTLSRLPRGPYLAQLEFLRQLQERNIPFPDGIDPPESIIREYYAKFGDKPSCFSDIKLFMNLLSSEQVQSMTDEYISALGLESDSTELKLAETPKAIQRHVFLLQLRHYAGLHDSLSHEDKITISKELFQRYKAGLEFGKDLLTTDLQYSDTYMVLASHLLVDVHLATGDRNTLWQAVVNLETALKNSPSNFQIKLLLIKLYALLGALGPCLTLYEAMEIKHIQNDSLGYTIVNHLSRLGQFSAAASIYRSMLRFFTVNHKDTTEYLISSYKFGSFSKTYEFVQFRERLQNSLQFASATTERMVYDLTLETSSHQATEQMLGYMEIDPLKDATVWEDLRDNRDLYVMINWDPSSRCLNTELCDQSFKEEVAWLKLRSLTLRSLAAAINLGKHGSPNNNMMGNGDTSRTSAVEVLQILLKEFQSHVQHCETLPLTTRYPICGPTATRLGTYIKGQYATTLIGTFELTLYIHALRENGPDKNDKSKEGKLKDIATQLQGYVSEACCGVLKKEADVTVFDPLGMDLMVHVAEILAQVTILLGVCHRMLKSLKSSIAKRNKKKKENPPALPHIFGEYNCLTSSLANCTKEADNTLSAVNDELLISHLSTIKIDEDNQNIDGAFSTELSDKLRASYEQSVREVQELINTKKTYIATLHL